MTTLTPHDLLAEAQRMLDEASTATVAVWPRAVALLTRQALEEAMRSYWAENAPGVERLNMRAQLTCLRVYLSSAVSRETGCLPGTPCRARRTTTPTSSTQRARN
jgi:hypothetical protein